MSSPVAPVAGPVSVVGGSGGLTANAAQILALGARYRQVATDCRHRSSALLALLDPTFGPLALAAGPALSASAANLLGVRADIADAADGLALVGAALDDLGGALVRTALRYDLVEQHLFGPGIGDVLHDLGGVARTAVGDTTVFLSTFGRTHNVSRSAQAALTADPGQLDVVARELLPGVVWFDLVARDSRGVAVDTGLDTAGAAGLPPRSLTDVLDDLAQRDADGRSGEIDVRILTLADGTRKVIVDVTGTKSWDPLPTHDVTSLSTNGRAVLGLDTAYEQGVLAAMRRAGVRRDDDVLMVGHSQGGMVVTDAARDAVRHGEFRVTHVITVGSPIGRTVGTIASTTRVLALENHDDVVPHVDGHANPDLRNVTTVTGRAGDGTISGDHDIVDSYEPIARATERSRARSVRDLLARLGDWFRAESVVTHTYQVERR